MDILLIAGIAVLYSFQTLFCTLFNKKYSGSPEDSSSFFCVAQAPVIALVSLAFNGWHFSPSAATLLLGFLNGVVLFVYNTSLIGAGRHGSYAFMNVCILFGGLLLPILYAAAACGEHPGALQWAAVAVVLLACWLMNKDDIRLSGTPGIYYVLCLVLFCVNGLYGILLKMQAERSPGEGKEMVILTFLSMGLIALVRLLFRRKKAALQVFRLPRGALWPLAACLVSAALAVNLFVLVLPLVSAPVLYTVNNGGVLLLSCIYSWIIFKEKLTAPKAVGVILSVAGIAALSL